MIIISQSVTAYNPVVFYIPDKPCWKHNCFIFTVKILKTIEMIYFSCRETKIELSDILSDLLKNDIKYIEQLCYIVDGQIEFIKKVFRIDSKIRYRPNNLL